MPLTSKTFTQLIDFTRTSAATYVDQLGRIVPTPVSSNLFTFTQEFDNAAWAKSSSTTTPNAAVAPDGSTTADLWRADAGTGITPRLNDGAVTVTANAICTLSVYFRPVLHTFVQAYVSSQGSDYANFTLTGAGSVTTFGSTLATVEQLPGGWYRLSFSYMPSAADRRPLISMIQNASAARAATWNPTGVETLHVWGAQLEQTPDANLTLGSELNAAAVPFTVFRDGSSNTPSPNLMSVTSGKVYRVQVNVSTNTSTNPASLRIAGVGVGVGVQPGATGNVIVYFTATSSGTLTFNGDAAGVNFTVTSASVREVTAASPSTYTRNFGGRFPPRFDYDPVTLAPRGLLIEEQRTNLFTRSEEFDNAAWTKTDSTATGNATTSPDGTVDADKVAETATTALHFVRQNPTVTAVAHTLSFYAKAAERTVVWATLDGASNTRWFDLSAVTTGGSAGNSGSSTITAVGGGWFRCTYTYTFAGTTSSCFIGPALNSSTLNYAGTAGSGIFVWGAQLEAGAFATSYIPTTTSQVTRTADSAAITGANFSPWFNQPEGTFVLEASTASTAAFPVIVGYNASSTASAAYLQANQAASWNGSAVLATGAGTVNSNVPVKVAMAYNATGRALVLNGGSVATDANQLGTANLLAIGRPGNAATSQLLNGHIRSIRYYPTRLTNAQLQALTA